jgi:hypothetical protein
MKRTPTPKELFLFCVMWIMVGALIMIVIQGVQ